MTKWLVCAHWNLFTITLCSLSFLSYNRWVDVCDLCRQFCAWLPRYFLVWHLMLAFVCPLTFRPGRFMIVWRFWTQGTRKSQNHAKREHTRVDQLTIWTCYWHKWDKYESYMVSIDFHMWFQHLEKNKHINTFTEGKTGKQCIGDGGALVIRLTQYFVLVLLRHFCSRYNEFTNWQT